MGKKYNHSVATMNFGEIQAYRVVDWRGVVVAVGTFADCKRMAAQRKDTMVSAYLG